VAVFGTTAFEDKPTGGAGHAGEKTVGASAFSFFGLISSFHESGG